MFVGPHFGVCLTWLNFHHQSAPPQHTVVSGPRRRPPNGTDAPIGTSELAQPPSPPAPEVPWNGHTVSTGEGTGWLIASVKATAASHFILKTTRGGARRAGNGALS